MSTLIVETRDGSKVELEGREGVSVMEHIRDAGIDELLALCGGCSSCATCHVFIDAPADAMLPKMSCDEDELLDSSAHRGATSRLSCQLPFNVSWDRMTVTIAPAD